MSISVQKNRYFTKRDQYKTKYYVVVRYQDAKAGEVNKEGVLIPKRSIFSCGNVNDPKSWDKAEQKLREVFEQKLQHILDDLEGKKSRFIRKEDDLIGNGG